MAYKSRKQNPPPFGLGQQDDAIALSVTGQVQKLIEEATSDYNLCQMFIGEESRGVFIPHSPIH